MRVTATDRFIRLLIALAGGDANQVELPPLKRQMHIVVQRTPDNGRLVVIAPGALSAPSADDTAAVPAIAGGSVVYLTGKILARPNGVNREMPVEVQGNEPPVTVRVPRGRCDKMLPGNIVFVQGRLAGTVVEGTVVSVVTASAGAAYEG
jgi:hypothetical protein